MRVVDLSHRMTNGVVTSHPLPGPQISEYLSFDRSREHYAEGTEFCIGQVTMLSATGTYLDAPYHRYRQGDDVAALPLARCVGLRVVIVAAENSSTIRADMLPHDFRAAAVVFRTGWDTHWGTDHYSSIQHPHLTEDCAQALVEGGATLVGVDSVNVDDTSGSSRPVHSTLLAAGIPIVENLTNLGRLTGGELFFAAPLAFVGMPSFPVRAHALQYTGAAA